MTQYINKDALMAEIEKTINEPYPKHDQQCDWEDGYCSGLYKALSIIEDTLEVKEVDSLTPEEIKKICTIYDNLKQERECATVLYNSDETFFNHVLMEYKSIAQKGE
jgi:hypothetical protein